MPARSDAPWFAFLCGCLVLLPTCRLAAAEQSSVRELLLEARDEPRSRTLPLKVYLPAVPDLAGTADQAKPTPSNNPAPSADRASSADPLAPATRSVAPVVLFSHGLGGSREGAAYLGRHWAESGYVGVFLQHPGSDESVWKDVAPLQRMRAMRQAAGAESFRQRVGDVPFVLDQLQRWNADPQHPLHQRMDLERIGMSGHSFGGVTTQAMMGQKYPLGRSFADPRLKAFLIMSPSPGRGNDPSRAFGHIPHPVLCMTGDRDASPLREEVTPESRREVYQALPKPDKFQVVFANGAHHIFSDGGRRTRDPRHHRAIVRLSTAFWDAYLKNDTTARGWIQSDQPRQVLVPSDVWQWK